VAAEVKGYAVDLSSLDQELAGADIVVSCTASPVPLITEAAAAAAVRARRHRPIFMVDLAVPRDIDPRVAALSDVYLFSIDDLQQLIDENRQQRQLAAEDARALLAEEVARFLAESRAHDAGPAIRLLRDSADAIRRQTMEQARRMLASGRSPEEAVEFLAATLTNRLLHAPTQALRNAAESADQDLTLALVRLLKEERGRS
jgi:glutamyl-tRNA reductase